MRHQLSGLGLLAGIIGMQPATGTAQDLGLAEAGRQIYEERCAICHGAGGKGDGAVGELFEVRPGDISELQQDNRFFPYLEVLAKIDGRELVVGHGTEMPIWGEAFMVETLEARGINPKDAAAIVNARLASLLFYLATLQRQ
jgi:mono/diheme cytochrome c family protein